MRASPSALLDLIQAPVILYLWIIVPVLYIAYWILIVLYLVCLPFPQSRRRMRARLAKLTVKNIVAQVGRIERWALRRNWSTCVFVILLGTPLVAMLCVLYGHHVISLSVYDSPFQSFAEIYGFLFLVLPLFVFQSSPITIPGFFLGIAACLLSVVFFGSLFFYFGAILWKGIHNVFRWHMLSIGLFTVLQPFVFRFLRFTALPWIGFTGHAPPFFGYNSTYAIAFFLPILVYMAIGMALHQYFQPKLPSWFLGLHAGLFYLSILAADLH